ncbi:MAG: D-alanyl-D-alanine carboxypeptidase [Chloroflexi bacterium]|nr:D-alanyl-D-alanine carboxypeptidase [Chloroflexota bacterium]
MVLVLLTQCSVAAGPPGLSSGHARPLRMSPAQVESMVAVRKGPEIDARAASLVDRQSNKVLWSKRANVVLPMASTTKLMTVLVALETLSPAQIVTVPEAALIGNASMGLKAGDQVSVESLVYGALLPSGNDAAMTLALTAAGSKGAFVQRMNQRAIDWGMAETHFENPHGLDEPGHVSSARDLISLAQHALANPLASAVVGTSSTTVEGYFLTNTNQLLLDYDGAYGVKTGTTDAAGQVLIAAASRPNGDALSVVLDSPDRFTETPLLLDHYFDYHEWVDLRLESNALNRMTGPDGSIYVLRTPERPLFLPKWQVSQLRPLRIISFDAAAQPAGLYQVWLGEEKLVETPILFEKQSREPATEGA